MEHGNENVHLLEPINGHDEHYHKTGIWRRFVVLGAICLLIGIPFLSLSLTLRISEPSSVISVNSSWNEEWACNLSSHWWITQRRNTSANPFAYDETCTRDQGGNKFQCNGSMIDVFNCSTNTTSGACLGECVYIESFPIDTCYATTKVPTFTGNISFIGHCYYYFPTANQAPNLYFLIVACVALSLAFFSFLFSFVPAPTGRPEASEPDDSSFLRCCKCIDRGDQDLKLEIIVDHGIVSPATCRESGGEFVYFIFMLPFHLISITEAIVMMAFTPVALILKYLEHHWVFVFFVIQLVVHTGGTIDVTTDIILFGKMLLQYYFRRYLNDAPHLADSLHEHEQVALNLLIARAVLTLICALPGLYLLRRMIQWIDRGKPAKDQFQFPKLGTSVLALVLLLVFWKLILIALRVTLLLHTLWAIFYYGHFPESFKRGVARIELLLVLDVLYSGLPLGLLTALELFYYEPDHLINPEANTILELFKLAALCVDLVGVSLFISELVQSWWHRRRAGGEGELIDAAHSNIQENGAADFDAEVNRAPTETNSLIEQKQTVAVI